MRFFFHYIISSLVFMQPMKLPVKLPKEKKGTTHTFFLNPP